MIYKIFSTEEVAKEHIGDFCMENEQDACIVHVKYPSGDEYRLRLISDLTFNDNVIYKHEVSCHIERGGSKYKFRDKKNAYLQGQKWANRIGIYLYIETHKYLKNKYLFISHYTISDKLTPLCELESEPIKPIKIKENV